MAQFIEVLKDGLTVERRVLRAGNRVQVTDAFKIVSARKQAKRWGSPRYREITQADFEGVGGEVQDDDGWDEDDSADESVEAPAAPAPFANLDGLNVDDTLEVASQMDEDQLAAFIEHEKAGANRSGVLGVLGAQTE